MFVRRGWLHTGLERALSHDTVNARGRNCWPLIKLFVTPMERGSPRKGEASQPMRCDPCVLKARRFFAQSVDLRPETSLPGQTPRTGPTPADPATAPLRPAPPISGLHNVLVIIGPFVTRSTRGGAACVARRRVAGASRFVIRVHESESCKQINIRSLSLSPTQPTRRE